VPAIALEIGANLHRQSLVKDVALHMASRCERDLASADAAFYAASHHDLLGVHIADNDRLLTDDQAAGADVAVDSAIDLHVAGREQRAPHDEIGADDGWRPVPQPALQCGRRSCSGCRDWLLLRLLRLGL
jgi:hypothetical protein